MQKKQLKSLKESINETWRIFRDKKKKKKYSGEKIYQEDLQQESYMDGQIRSMMKSTR